MRYRKNFQMGKLTIGDMNVFIISISIIAGNMGKWLK